MRLEISDPDAPEGHIWSTKGYIPLEGLDYVTTITNNKREYTVTTEYYQETEDAPELVRKDVHIALKDAGVVAEVLSGKF